MRFPVRKRLLVMREPGIGIPGWDELSRWDRERTAKGTSSYSDN